MTPPSIPTPLVADKAPEIDVRAERAAFKIWWATWVPGTPAPASTSYIFDAWLASARHAAKATGR